MTKEDLIKKLGLEKSDPLTQQALLQQVSDAVSTRILNKVTELLSDDDLEKIGHMIDTNQNDEIERYIMSKIPNYEGFKAQIEDETINEIANNSAGLTNQIMATSQEKIKD